MLRIIKHARTSPLKIEKSFIVTKIKCYEEPFNETKHTKPLTFIPEKPPFENKLSKDQCKCKCKFDDKFQFKLDILLMNQWIMMFLINVAILS